jgi:hypothetical protein
LSDYGPFPEGFEDASFDVQQLISNSTCGNADIDGDEECDYGDINGLEYSDCTVFCTWDLNECGGCKERSQDDCSGVCSWRPGSLFGLFGNAECVSGSMCPEE